MLNKFLSLIFPSVCLRCKRIVKHGFLCRECREEYEKELSDGCLSCGNPHEKCRCDTVYLENEHLIYAIPYKSDGVSRQLLLKLKTSKNKELVSHLTDKMASALKANGIKDERLITYVPRSKIKARIDGVDQARALSRSLSNKLGYRLEPLLICHGGVKEQKALEYSERDAAARSRFSLRLGAEEILEGKSVLLVDDIITSGATAKTVSQMLLAAGAKDVICLSAGRSVKY